MKLGENGVVCVSLLLILALGCRDGRVYIDPEPRDLLLANQTVKLVENEFLKLESNHPIIARYGEFVSLVPGEVIKGRAHQVFDLDCPAHLTIKNCHCAFAKYAARIDILIVEGTGPQVTFSLSEHRSDGVPVERDGELWFDYGNWGEDGSHRSPSRIECRVTHPDFLP